MSAPSETGWRICSTDAVREVMIDALLYEGAYYGRCVPDDIRRWAHALYGTRDRGAQ